jgi:aspartate racemase
MEQDFYKGRLVDRHGLEVIIPNDDEREIVHRVIYNELCVGERNESSKAEFLHIMENLAANGAEGIILGCTEIGLLVSGEDSRVPVFDTARIHATAAARYALEP